MTSDDLSCVILGDNKTRMFVAMQNLPISPMICRAA